MDLKNVNTPALHDIIYAAAARALASFGPACDSMRAQLEETVAGAKTAATLVAEMASIDASTLLGRALLAHVEEIEVRQLDFATQRTPKVNVQLDVSGQGPTMLYVAGRGDLHQAQFCYTAKLPAGVYRFITVAIPVGEGER